MTPSATTQRLPSGSIDGHETGTVTVDDDCATHRHRGMNLEELVVARGHRAMVQSPRSSWRLGGGSYPLPMAVPDRDSLANGLVSIGEDAVAKSNDALLDDYYTDDYKLHSPAGTFNRDEIKSYFAALRDSFTDFTISRAQIIVDGNFVSARTVMAGRFDKEFAYTPIGAVEPNGRQVRWELINIFRYTDEGRLVEEWVQTDTYDFLRQLGAVT